MFHGRHGLAAAAFLVVVVANHLNAQTDAEARKGVDRSNQSFIAALKAGDADAAAALMTANASVVEEDGSRSDGRPAVVAGFKGFLSTLKVSSMTIAIDAFGSSGNTAWASGKETATFVDKKTNKPIPVEVQYLAIYERQTNGTYLCRYWLETKMPPAPGK